MDWSIPSSFEHVRKLRESSDYALFQAFDTSRSVEALVWCMHEHDGSLDKAVQLRMPQFARILGRGHSQANAYVIQAMPDGQPLSEIAGATESVPIETLVNVALQSSLALTLAHQNGLTLSNVSLNNCYLSEKQRLQIIGLGLGSIAANPLYDSPETKDGGPTDVASDIFSLGSLLYELAVGFPPFAGNSDAELDRAIAYQPPPRIAPVRPELASLEAILFRCLAKNPEERFSGAAELTATLIAEGPHPTHKATRSRPVLTWVFAGLAALAGAALVFYVGDAGTASLKYRQAAPLARWTTVALMPIEQRGEPDPSQQARLLQGIEDVIVGTIASNTPLTMVSTLSTRVYTKSAKPMPQIADELGADAILEVSLLHGDRGARLQLRCADAESGVYAWERTLDLETTSVVEVQNLVEAALYTEFESIWMGSHDQMLRASTTEAYELFLEGKHLSRQFTADAMQQALEILKQAVSKDPNFAPGWASLSRSYSTFVNVDAAGASEWLRLAEESAEKAIDLAPSMPDGYSARGVAEATRYFYLGEGDRIRAERDFDRALARSQDYPDALLNKAFLLSSRGLVGNDHRVMGESLSFYERALRIQPNLPPAVANYAITLALTGQEALAHSQLARAIQVTPDSVLLHTTLANVAYMQRDFDTAIVSAETALNLDLASHERHQPKLASFLVARGDRDRAQTLVEEYNANELQSVGVFHLASTFAGLGRNSEALECLEVWSSKTPALSEQRGQFRWWFENDPNLNELRDRGELERFMGR